MKVGAAAWRQLLSGISVRCCLELSTISSFFVISPSGRGARSPAHSGREFWEMPWAVSQVFFGSSTAFPPSHPVPSCSLLPRYHRVVLFQSTHKPV